MNVLQSDPAWQSVVQFLVKSFTSQSRIMAPAEFCELFSRTVSYEAIRYFDPRQIDAFVVHKGRLAQIEQKLCTLLMAKGVALFGNEVFVVYSLQGEPLLNAEDNAHFTAFHQKAALEETFKASPAAGRSEFSSPATVVLVTTFNRPNRLAHSLETISTLKAPILVVDDGSDRIHDEAYSAVYKKFDVRVLNLPGNRGLAHALNAGLLYWLSDPGVAWICYLQDDVEVRADLLVALARVQDKEKYPLLTGRFNSLGKVYGETEVNGQKVLLQRMVSGRHLHAHRTYWEKVLPIPTFYFQAPKHWPGSPPQGSGADWWITQWSPNSLGQQGQYIGVLPGLVRTHTVLAEESTWGNPCPPEPSLPPPQYPVEDFTPATRSTSPPQL